MSSHVNRSDAAGAARPRQWQHPSDQRLRGFVLDNRAALGTLAVFIVMMAVFMIANPTRLHHLVALQLGADHAAGRAVPGGAAGLRRHLRRDRPVVPGDDGLCRLGLRAGRAGRLRSVPRHCGGDRHRHGARLPASASLVVYGGPVVADRHARHEFHAARPDPDHQRGQVDRADRPRRQLGLQDLLQPGLWHSGADLLGPRLRRVRRRCSTTAIASARR